MDKSDKKVIVIGLDGATFNLIKPWAEEGILPNIKKLMEEGTWGNLQTVRPHCTGPAWTSFATGKNPGNHGIFDFLIPQKSLSNLKTIDSKDIRAETFYEIINDNALQCALINLPVSYPPRIKNVTITSLLTEGEDFIFPPNLIEKVPELKDYRITPDPNISATGSVNRYIEDIRSLENVRFHCVKKIFELKDWNFFFYLISGTDWIQHRTYYNLIGGNYNKDSQAVKAFHDFDNYIGWFRRNLKKNATLILVSDHGFTARKFLFHINTWLRNEGYLTVADSRPDVIPITRGSKEFYKADRRFRVKVNKELIKILNRYPKIRNVARFMFHGIKKMIPLKFEEAIARTDTKNSKALVTQNGVWGVYINDSKRFKDGIVQEKSEYEKLRREIKEKLAVLRHPKSGERIFTKVDFKEYVYSGRYLEDAPDILLESNIGHPTSLITHNEFRDVDHNGHSPQGIFIAYGDHIKQNTKLSKLSIIDIAPTILYILDLPVVEDMDGNVLKSIFRDGSEVLKHEIKYKKPAKKYYQERYEQRIKKEADEEIKNRLRALGYL